jgi:hypothetical protein
MAVNRNNTRPGDLVLTGGGGIDISGGVVTNTMAPATVVLDNAITDPATITTFGGAYIVPATGALGAWASQANNIAVTVDNGATWTFTTPTTGTRRQVTAGPNAGATYRWTGTVWELVVPTAPPGAILKMQVFSGAEVTASATSSFTTTTLAVSYTPVSASSYLLIEADASYYVNGASGDTWGARLVVAGATQRTKAQLWTNGAGGGTRGSTALPISGRYTNSSVATKAIQVVLERNAGDDTGALNGTDRQIVVTEIKR